MFLCSHTAVVHDVCGSEDIKVEGIYTILLAVHICVIIASFA